MPKKFTLRKFLLLMLSAALALSCFACAQSVPADSQQTKAADDSTTTSAAEKDSETEAATEALPVEQKLTKLVVAWNEVAENTATKEVWPTEIASQIFLDTGVEYSIDGMDDEKFQVLLAGGDLPDILYMQNTSWLKQLIEGEQIIPLDDLVAGHGPDIIKNTPEMLNLMREYASNGTGLLYALGSGMGQNVPGAKIDLGYHIRWDYYQEMGYPEVKNLEDFERLLVEMHELHPTTDAGLPTYAVGCLNDWWGGLWVYNIQCFREGWAEMPTVGYKYSFTTNEIINDYTKLDGPMWNTIRHLNTLDRLGLFDRDSFTMNTSEYSAKARNGQYLSDFIVWFINAFESDQKEANPDSHAGYELIPVEGSSITTGALLLSGTGKVWAITKNCSDPELAMSFINYYFSSKGLRTQNSGIQGKHWDIIDGEPQFLPDVVDKINNPDYKKVIGSMDSNWNGMYATSFVCEDGGLADLKASDIMKARIKEEGTWADKDYCEHFEVNYPAQVILNEIAEGRMIDQTNLLKDLHGLLGAPPDDIKRIDAACDELIKTYGPKLVMAADDTEFDSLQGDLIKDLEAANIAVSEEWWFNRYNTLKEEYLKVLEK